MKTTDKEQKDIIAFAKKFFKAKKEPTTVAMISVNQDDGAGAYGVGDTDEIITGLVMFAKQLEESSRYALCSQVLATLPNTGIALAVEEALSMKGDLKVKKSKLN